MPIRSNLNQRFSDLLPLPRLDLSALTKPRACDQRYFKYYGLNFHAAESSTPALNAKTQKIAHYFGSLNCSSSASGSDHSWDIATHIYLPDNAQGSVFLFHGLFDHAGIYNHIIKFALSQNFAVFIFDLPGHGLSSGARAEISSFRQYTDVATQLLDQVAQLMPQPWHVVAQSTGASVVMDLLTHRPSAFRTHAVLAPLVRPHLWQYSQYAFYFARLFISQQRRKFTDNSNLPGFTNFLKTRDDLQPQILKVCWINAMHQHLSAFQLRECSSIPLFIVQGQLDTTVDWKFNLDIILKKFPQSKSLIIKEAKHQLLNEHPAIRSKYQKLLAKLWHHGPSAL